MLKYLIVQLCDSAPSFCYYNSLENAKNLISIEDLKQSLLWAMKENVIVQFVYPDYELPEEYYSLINSVDHINIKANSTECDITIYNRISLIPDSVQNSYSPKVLRLSKQEFFNNVTKLQKFPILNIVITDIYTLTESEHKDYINALDSLSSVIKKRIEQNEPVHCNLITDRIHLSAMNNCNAGVESITLAPDGNFYICPAFYYDKEDNVGNPKEGLSIPNQQLFKLENAPICKRCDAFKCKRCVWLNKKTTCEVNIPSHEQCCASHIERNASRILLESIKDSGCVDTDKTICKISYLDPFEQF